MNWIISSILMSCSSILYYLLIRYGQKRGVTVKEYMSINYPLPTLLFAIMLIMSNQTFILPIHIVPFVLFHGLILEYFGGTISYKAIHAAPNAGYSLVIQKSYAIYTSIAAIFIFNAPLPFWKFITILTIVVLVGIVSIDLKQSKRTKSNWFLLSIIPFFLFGTNSLVSKYAVTNGANLLTYLFWLFLLMTIITSMDILKRKNTTPFNTSHWKTLLAIGLSGTSFYYFKNVAQIAAPNVGYVGAINSASNAFVTLFAALLFKEHLTNIKLGAIIGIVAGVIIIIL